MSPVFIGTPTETFTPTQSGAIATIFWELCREAAASGIEPTVIARQAPAEPYAWSARILLEAPPLPRHPLGRAWFRAERWLTGWTQLRHRTWALRIARAISRAGLQERPLIVNNDPETAVLLRSRFPKAFIAHWFHNQLPCKPRARSRFSASVDVTFAVSDFTARWIEEYYGLPTGHVRTVYNAVDLDAFTPSSGPHSGPPVINFVGRTGIEKAPDLLLRAALRLSDKTRDFRLQLVGSNHWGRFELDDYQRELQSLVEQLERLGVEVRQAGHVGRTVLPQELRKAAIHVVPSRWDEPFGLVTLEGMASGLATVASRTGGTPEVVGDAGLLFERDSVEGLADHLERLVRDRDLLSRYGREGRTRAEAFTWGKTWATLRGAVGV